jgi:nonribosomal peptide synthetase protein VioO
MRVEGSLDAAAQVAAPGGGGVRTYPAVGVPAAGAAPAGDVVDGFLAVAGAHPGRVAIVHNGQELSYAELRARVLAMAGRLGPRPGVVGVSATHSPGTVTALLGVWAAGGTYCPVDPGFPAQRRAAMLAAAGCRMLLDPDSRPAAGAVADLPGSADRTGPDQPGGLAYILFTSGSTGEPKPVLTPRLAIGVTARSLRQLFGLTPADRVLQFASLNWDTCFEEIVPTLTGGACLVFHDDARSGSFPRFLRMIESERITVLDLPTAFWHELVNYLADTGMPLPGCVRLVIIGGEAVSPARLVGWCTLRTGHARLINTYGCTETTLITHAVDLHGPQAAGRGTSWRPTSRVPIGRPLPHVVEHISGEGELLIGGPSLAAGYGGLPEATSARFVTAGGRRYFRTGDRVSRMPDGALRLEGRMDHEVKIRGIRVDPAEVEAHIAGHPAVSAVAVTGVRVADHTVLAAYVVARPPAGGAGLAASIIDYLRGRVPAHLVPSRVRVVADLVYTATGKVDRHRIREALP